MTKASQQLQDESNKNLKVRPKVGFFPLRKPDAHEVLSEAKIL